MCGLEYMVESTYDEDEQELMRRVNKHISEGWEPIGGISISCGPSLYAWAQALCRRTKTKEETVTSHNTAHAVRDAHGENATSA